MVSYAWDSASGDCGSTYRLRDRHDDHDRNQPDSGVQLLSFSEHSVRPRKTWITFQNVAILLLISLALTPAFRMRFWNIGGEGQVLIGGLASAACMICLADKLPNAVVILLMVVTSIGAGALWGAIPAFFKAKWNTNETLSTLMMNYIATQLVAFLHDRVGDAERIRKDRYHQSEDEYRLAAGDVWFQISAEHYRGGDCNRCLCIFILRTASRDMKFPLSARA